MRANAMTTFISQEGQPVIYLSRKLKVAETNYKNIEKEALVIVWSTKMAWNFLLGRTIFLKSTVRIHI